MQSQALDEVASARFARTEYLLDTRDARDAPGEGRSPDNPRRMSVFPDIEVAGAVAHVVEGLVAECGYEGARFVGPFQILAVLGGQDVIEQVEVLRDSIRPAFR